jgi:hypothetical protein
MSKIVNLSSMLFYVSVQFILSEGLNYTVTATVLPTEDIISVAEIVICALHVKAVDAI